MLFMEFIKFGVIKLKYFSNVNKSSIDIFNTRLSCFQINFKECFNLFTFTSIVIVRS